MKELTGVVRHYPWGSPTAIPTLIGKEPDGRPWAELWLGAHPSAPATVAGAPLDDVITDNPSVVGEQSVARFGPRLPYLLKVLAANQALSIQAHPSRSQAELGFAREEAHGPALDAPSRNYKDAWPKPEILCALENFEALYGFADPIEIVTDLTQFEVPALTAVIQPLQDHPDAAGLRTVFLSLFELSGDQLAVVDQVVAAAHRLAGTASGTLLQRCRTVIETAQDYPGDPGIIVATLLNRMSLRAGEAIYLPAGNVHAYLRGTGVELMANSDNVLRGGLTGKHIDVAELAAVVDFSPIPPAVAPVISDGPGIERFVTDAPEFCLWRLRVEAEGGMALPGVDRGRIALCTAGTLTLVSAHDQADLTLAPGQSAWLPAHESVTVSVSPEGTSGQLFVAAAGIPSH